MKITIFGATGRTGIHTVKKALEMGHEVKAFVRSPEKMTIQDPNLHLIQGDVFSKEDVAEAVKGSDAVISTLGPTKNSPPDFMKKSAENITAAMKEHDSSRLLWMTGAGVKDPEDPPSILRNMIIGIMKLIAPSVLNDSRNAYEIISNSELDYTIARVPVLSDKGPKQPVHSGLTPPAPKPVERADIADFLINQLEDSTWKGKAPFIGY